MVVPTFKSEEGTSSSWVKDFNSVRWELVANEIERQVDVLEEQCHREETFEELSWRVIFDDLHPDLLLLAPGRLLEVVRVTEVHVIWPYAAKLVGSPAVIIGLDNGIIISQLNNLNSNNAANLHLCRFLNGTVRCQFRGQWQWRQCTQ